MICRLYPAQTSAPILPLRVKPLGAVSTIHYQNAWKKATFQGIGLQDATSLHDLHLLRRLQSCPHVAGRLLTPNRRVHPKGGAA